MIIKEVLYMYVGKRCFQFNNHNFTLHTFLIFFYIPLALLMFHFHQLVSINPQFIEFANTISRNRSYIFFFFFFLWSTCIYFSFFFRKLSQLFKYIVYFIYINQKMF